MLIKPEEIYDEHKAAAFDQEKDKTGNIEDLGETKPLDEKIMKPVDTPPALEEVSPKKTVKV